MHPGKEYTGKFYEREDHKTATSRKLSIKLTFGMW